MRETELVSYFCWTKVTKIITQSEQEWLPQKKILCVKTTGFHSLFDRLRCFVERVCVNEYMFWEHLRGKLLLIRKEKHKPILDIHVQYIKIKCIHYQYTTRSFTSTTAWQRFSTSRVTTLSMTISVVWLSFSASRKACSLSRSCTSRLWSASLSFYSRKSWNRMASNAEFLARYFGTAVHSRWKKKKKNVLH